MGKSIGIMNKKMQFIEQCVIKKKIKILSRDM